LGEDHAERADGGVKMHNWAQMHQEQGCSDGGDENNGGKYEGNTATNPLKTRIILKLGELKGYRLTSALTQQLSSVYNQPVCKGRVGLEHKIMLKNIL